jgi:hypothetical protein
MRALHSFSMHMLLLPLFLLRLVLLLLLTQRGRYTWPS